MVALGIGVGMPFINAASRGYAPPVVPGASLDLRFTEQFYSLGGTARSLSLDFTSGAADAYFWRNRMTVFSDFQAFLTDIGGSSVRGSSATRFSSAGALETVANNVPRIDYDPVTLACKGVLSESARTNYVRNSISAGAVAGAPGTIPTNWTALSAPVGLAREVVGAGTVDGIPYVDIRYFGTASATGPVSIFFDAVTAANEGENWTASVFCSLVGGSLAGINTIDLRVRAYDAVPTEISPVAGTNLAGITNAPLRTQRWSASRLGMPVGTTGARADIRIALTTGAAVDFTLRIGLPQWEIGAYATSPILTSGAAASRAADNVQWPVDKFIGLGEGTLFVEFTPADNTGGTAARRAVEISDNTTANAIMIGKSTANKAQAVNTVGSSQNMNISGAATHVSDTLKAAVAYKANSFAFASDGEAVATDATGTVAPFTTMHLGGGAGWAAAKQADGWVRKVTYFPVRRTDAEVQALAA